MSQNIDRLWAPWRLEYIKKEKERDEFKKGATFSNLARQEPSAENLILYKEKDFFIVMNKFPYNPNHLMVIPCQKVAKLEELDTQVWMKMCAAAQLTVKILKQNLNPGGFNIGMNIGATAGAGIAEHLHLHILPRWSGDTNFMPLIAETKNLPVHNRSVYDELKPLFDNFAEQLASIIIEK